MENNINKDVLSVVAKGELARLTNKTSSKEGRIASWNHAVEKAWAVLVGNEQRSFRVIGDKLAVVGSTGNIYLADRNTCECNAFVAGDGTPCYHRAMHTLLTKVREVEAIFARGGR